MSTFYNNGYQHAGCLEVLGKYLNFIEKNDKFISIKNEEITIFLLINKSVLLLIVDMKLFMGSAELLGRRSSEIYKMKHSCSQWDSIQRLLSSIVRLAIVLRQCSTRTGHST